MARRWFGGIVAMLVVGCAGCTSAPPVGDAATSASPSGSSPTASQTVTPSPTLSSTPTPSATPTPTPDPGELPQTQEQPQGTDPEFTSRMQALWRAIETGDAAAGQEAFFPLGAYRQVKAINDPDGDYRNRLFALYGLDIAALHQRVGAGATLLGIDVPDGQAVWVEPGQEYNKGAYWRVYGTRMRYRTADGTEGSFGIFSLISWRGQWHVVHLGPIERAPGTGAITP